MPDWSFEAEYFTACNCDWGCPCNFDARPTEGRCMGWSIWSILTGRFGDTALDGTRFGIFYSYPGPVAEGNGTACVYIDDRATDEQRAALETIGLGRAGGGIFQLFGEELVTKWLPTKVVPIDYAVEDGVGRISVDGFGEMESELLSYPDGTVIRPSLDLPHGIEFKQGLMTNARRWWVRDDPMLARYQTKYGAAARVRFTQEGCVA